MLSPEDAFKWFQETKFSETPPYFLSHWKTGKKFFYAGNSLLAYEETKTHFVIAGEPVSEEGADKKLIYASFKAFSEEKNKNLCGYYVGDKWEHENIYKVQVGTSSSICLEGFDLESSSSKEVRRALRKGNEFGYVIRTVSSQNRIEAKGVEELVKKWRKAKSFIKLKFLLSSPRNTGLTVHLEKWVTVEKDGEAVAFCSLLPYLQEGKKSYYVDNIVYNPESDPHALSFLISSLILSLKFEGVCSLDLGLNPFARVEGAGFIKSLFRFFYKSPIVYKPKGLHFFKTKFSGLEKREYCFFQSKYRALSGLLNMARVTF